MMNADKQTFLTQTGPKNKYTNIRYYISREKARPSGKISNLMRGERYQETKISAGE
jgi:hypothetical protein